MMKKLLFALALFSVTAVTAPIFAQEESVIMGVMQHTDIEGGCWFLQAKKQKYELTGTADVLRSCQVVGRHLVLNVRDAEVKHSICMIGKMVEVLTVLDSVMHPHDPPVYEKKINGRVHKTKSGCWYVLTADRHKFEIQSPIPKQFMRIGARYNRLSKVLPGGEGNCEMEGVITVTLLELELERNAAREKKHDPR